MPRRDDQRIHPRKGGGRVTIKDVARHVGLSPATVSLVLNRAPTAASIPQPTQDRILAAVEELNYRPDRLAQSLRRGRSASVGILVPDIGEAYAAGIMGGVERGLSEKDYLFLAASHRWDLERLAESLDRLEDRSVDGLILVATPIREIPGLPTVVVAGHERLPGVTNVIIDHDVAAAQALSHLAEHGHERIAVLKGHHPLDTDTADRWRAVAEAAQAHGVEVPPELVKELGDGRSRDVFAAEARYREGFGAAREVLAEGVPFTALFAFDDISAIGATRALLDAGLRVPEDVSVIGFDDVQSARFQSPGLTTIRQPLREMGELAARTLLARIAGGAGPPDVLSVEPVLVIRESTGPAPARARR